MHDIVNFYVNALIRISQSYHPYNGLVWVSGGGANFHIHRDKMWSYIQYILMRAQLFFKEIKALKYVVLNYEI